MLRRATAQIRLTLAALLQSFCTLCLPGGELVLPLLTEAVRRARRFRG
jgi:hypothetical protein